MSKKDDLNRLSAEVHYDLDCVMRKLHQLVKLVTVPTADEIEDEYPDDDDIDKRLAAQRNQIADWVARQPKVEGAFCGGWPAWLADCIRKGEYDK